MNDDTAASAPQDTVPLKQTLQLPETSFAMRANLAEKEPKILADWAQQNLWQKIHAARAGRPRFVLHDGPPYANGGLHHGHLLNKILKDLVVKDRTMAGYEVDYRPGWDCHGLPIETQVDKQLGGKKREMSVADFQAACRAWADKFVQTQRDAFVRLGVFGDWQSPYRTMEPAYQGDIVHAFADLFATGLVYRGLRPVHWCTTHRTALAEAEVEYDNKRSASIYVRFAIDAPEADAPPMAAALQSIASTLDVAIWTTTPWSLPGNIAVVVHPEARYVAAPYRGRHVLVAEQLWSSFCQATGEPMQALSDDVPRLLGSDLVGLRYQHPFLPRHGQIVADTFVALDTGTGAVHAAPAHGAEDFAMATRLGLAFPSPVDAAGRMMAEAGPFVGQTLDEASKSIIAHLQQSEALLNAADASIEHRYAHCWRCHRPVITRATEQWFVDMDKPFAGGGSLRERVLQALGDVEWIPGWGIERIRGMLANRPDWCLSRQRTWGVPLPIVYCSGCETPWTKPEAMHHAAEVIAKQDASVWATGDLVELYGEQPVCEKCQGASFRRGEDILDVWFDSGVSWYAVLGKAQLTAQPKVADLYLEGSDQHRGWFHSSLLTSMALQLKPPYKACLTHGFVVDGQGKKISKSKGNFTDPFVSIAKEGAEVWRLWVATEDYQQDVRISPNILKQLSDAYRKVRNTIRYLLGNLAGFSPQTDLVSSAQMQPFDVWAVGEVMATTKRAQKAFAACAFHTGVQELLECCNVFLSAFYLDVLKDRLYASRKGGPERQSAQSALYVIARDLLRMLAPVLCFTAEEAWQLLPRMAGDADSVHLMRYPGEQEPEALQQLRDGIAAQMASVAPVYEYARQLRRASNAALELARQDKQIGSSTAARLHVHVPKEQQTSFAALDVQTWADLLIVSEVSSQVTDEQTLQIEVHGANGQKCKRCWLYRQDDTPAHAEGYICRRCDEAIA